MNFTTGKIVLLIFLSIILFMVGYNYFNHTYIRAEFNKTDPLPAKMGVYYKGYLLGSSNRVKISKDFKTTYLYITLNQRGLHLPKNITASVKNYDEDTKYVDINYPAAPMLKYIKTGDIIKGETPTSFGNISDINQNHLDNLSEKGENLLSSATKATESLTDLFDVIIEMLNENRENLRESSSSLRVSMANLETSTRNLKELSQKLNDEISRETVRRSALNLEMTTSNFANSSKELITISGNFNKTSSDFSVLIPKLSVLIDAVQLTVCNINEIIVGLKKTLQKRMGGARIIFGKPVSE